ncbi:Ig-like domain-containing protein [Yinghuangia seranimata]|nr:Ig-like domain-containing protein [Yinghuangia seranimata]MDI2130912.1 Ig-like domain-containing protein [Yinghuangia seranimata]
MVVGAGAAACSGGGGGKKPAAQSPGQSGTGRAPASVGPPPVPPPQVVVAPDSGAGPIAPDKPVSVTVVGGRVDSVALTVGGKELKGATSADGTGWASTEDLDFGKTYTVKVAAVGADGQRAEKTVEFTTLTPKRTLVGIYTPDDGTTVGVGMPVSITFNRAVAEKAKVERLLTVTTEPAVEGSWSWLKNFDGKDRVDWRPKEYWPAGTKVRLQMKLLGVDVGDGTYGSQNRDVAFTIGRSVVTTVDTAVKRMSIVVDGAPLKTLPVSSGKPGFETWNGTMVVIGKTPSIDMNSDTVGIFGVEGYDIKDVKWDVQLTPSGTFVHAAPWNEGKFGRVNGSHGCIGMSTEDAQFFFEQTAVGDVVTVVNSKDTVQVGNGFGCWNVAWPEWVAGSALH